MTQPTPPPSPRSHAIALCRSQDEQIAQIRSYLIDIPPSLLADASICITGSSARAECPRISASFETRAIELIVLLGSCDQLREDMPTPSGTLTVTPDDLLRDHRSSPERLLREAAPAASLSNPDEPLDLSFRFQAAAQPTPPSPQLSPERTGGGVSAHFLYGLSAGARTTIEKVQEVVRMHPSIFDQKISIHVVGSRQHPLKLERGKEQHTVIPNRALDAVLIAGNPALAKKYRQSAFHALPKLSSSERKDFNKHFYQRAVKELEHCLTGTSKESVDLATGALFFDGENAHSTKYALLRPVQYHLTLLLMHALHTEAPSNAALDALEAEMPYATIERIRWMKEARHLPECMTPEQVDNLCAAYRTALYWYERSQTAYHNKEQKQTFVDPLELRRVADTIKNFTEVAPASLSTQHCRKKPGEGEK